MNHPHTSLRQYSDQMFCRQCGKQWDVNDPDPPLCIARMTPQQQVQRLRDALARSSAGKDGKDGKA